MEPMFLREVEEKEGRGPYGELIRMAKASGGPVSQIFHLFAFKPEATGHLAQFTQAVMRDPSPLSPGLRELMAAFVSGENQCPF